MVKKISILILVVLIGYSNCLFFKKYDGNITLQIKINDKKSLYLNSWLKDEFEETSRLIKAFNLIYPEKNIDFQEQFPNLFVATFNEFGHDLEIKYERTNRESNSYGDIYIIDSNSGKPVKYDLTNTEVNNPIKKLSLNQSLYCIILL